jgi:excinuclease UvrABC nuclease subunit
MVLRYLKGKVVGERTKMRKVDKSMSKEEESVLEKIIGNFFDKERKVTRIVTDMVED